MVIQIFYLLYNSVKGFPSWDRSSFAQSRGLQENKEDGEGVKELILKRSKITEYFKLL